MSIKVAHRIFDYNEVYPEPSHVNVVWVLVDAAGLVEERGTERHASTRFWAIGMLHDNGTTSEVRVVCR